jgi:hypothetical protein
MVVLRVTVSSALAAGLAFATWYGLDAVFGAGIVAEMVSLGAAFAVAGVVYLGAARLLGLRELETLLLLRARREEP